MKRFALFLLALIALTACAHKSAPTPTPPTPTATNEAEALRKVLNPFDTGAATVSGPYPTHVDNRTPFFHGHVDNEHPEYNLIGGIVTDQGEVNDLFQFCLVKPKSRVVQGNLRGKEDQDLGPIRIVDYGSNDEALQLMNDRGLRPATVKGLIQFANQHGELIKKFGEVIALGNVWKGDDGYPYIGAVYRDDDGLHLTAYPALIGPGSRTLFLAAPK